MIAQGYSNREIAEKTGYPFDTVRGQVVGLLAVFEARNRTHLAALAVSKGYATVLE